jgi:hypothetical protein
MMMMLGSDGAYVGGEDSPSIFEPTEKVREGGGRILVSGVITRYCFPHFVCIVIIAFRMYSAEEEERVIIIKGKKREGNCLGRRVVRGAHLIPFPPSGMSGIDV